MVDNVVLFMMQVNGMSRKTIYKNFQLEKADYSLEDIQMLIKEAALSSKKIVIPTIQELELAKKKKK